MTSLKYENSFEDQRALQSVRRMSMSVMGMGWGGGVGWLLIGGGPVACVQPQTTLHTIYVPIYQKAP